MNAALQACLRAPPQADTIDNLALWWPRWCALGELGLDPAVLALKAGFDADRVGWAFAGGYQAALRALWPELPHQTMAALCVTEAGGNRPRDIRTTITLQGDGGLRIDGAKRWTTLGPISSVLLVAGLWPAPVDAQHPLIRLVAVAVPSPGLTLTPMPATGFVPEVPHAQVLLEGVRAGSAALLPGDGYDRYVKPFRTIEDVHVTLAVMAYLLREARARGWPAALREELVGLLCLLLGLAHDDASSATTHVALAGALHWAQRLYGDATTQWAAGSADAAAQRWLRDLPLMQVAGTARAARAERAWARMKA